MPGLGVVVLRGSVSAADNMRKKYEHFSPPCPLGITFCFFSHSGLSKKRFAKRVNATAWSVPWVDPATGRATMRIIIYAIKPIKKGRTIYWDYGDLYWRRRDPNKTFMPFSQ